MVKSKARHPNLLLQLQGGRLLILICWADESAREYLGVGDGPVAGALRTRTSSA